MGCRRRANPRSISLKAKWKLTIARTVMKTKLGSEGKMAIDVGRRTLVRNRTSCCVLRPRSAVRSQVLSWLWAESAPRAGCTPFRTASWCPSLLTGCPLFPSFVPINFLGQVLWGELLPSLNSLCSGCSCIKTMEARLQDPKQNKKKDQTNGETGEQQTKRVLLMQFHSDKRTDFSTFRPWISCTLFYAPGYVPVSPTL